MKKFDKILGGLKDKSPLPYMLEIGYTPEEIKSEIKSAFQEYFRNEESLDKYAINFLVSDWINYQRLKIQKPGIENDIKDVVNFYNEAKSINSEMTFDILSSLSEMHTESGNKYWSFLNLEVDKEHLEIYEFADTSFKDIVNIVEGISKSLYIEVSLISKLVRRKRIDIEKSKQNKLGNLIQDLKNNTEFSHLFIVPDENIKLSDWRNIGAHGTYSIVKNLIKCEYGEGANKQNFHISKENLFKRVGYCMRTAEVLNMAHKLFAFDNLPEISKRLKHKEPNARPEIGFLMFSSALLSQGFEVKNLNYDNETAELELFDLTKEDPQRRGIHSSQMLNQLWLLTNSKALKIKYIKNDNQLYLTSSISSKIFKEMESNKLLGIEYFAKNVRFKLNNGG